MKEEKIPIDVEASEPVPFGVEEMTLKKPRRTTAA
jgi:hypothetical protein